METKEITIPFDLERAKRITNGEEEGKIITGDGRKARIICWDAKVEQGYPIGALISEGNIEVIKFYRTNGDYNSAPSNEYAKLKLSVPDQSSKDSNYSNIGKEYNLEPFQKVLCRDHKKNKWTGDFFLHMFKDGRFCCVSFDWRYCIPYNEQTKHLLNTTDNWEAKQ